MFLPNLQTLRLETVLSHVAVSHFLSNLPAVFAPGSRQHIEKTADAFMARLYVL